MRDMRDFTRPARRTVLAALAALAGLAATGPGLAQTDLSGVPSPGPRDTCPVCGMFVAKYPEWVATILYPDGHSHHFDGAKDLFKYLGNPEAYGGHAETLDAALIAVTDYYTVELIDAETATFVIGSDVYGPMGHELIPHRTRADADAFSADHGGRNIVTFADVNAELIARLDAGDFD